MASKAPLCIGPAKKVSSLTVVTGAAQGIELGPGLTSVTKMIEAAGKNTFNWLYSSYYRKLERNLVNAAAADLFAKRINAEKIDPNAGLF